MFTEIDLDVLYTYHPPTSETADLYDEVREAERANQRLIDHLETSFAQDIVEGVTDGFLNTTYYGQINEATRKTADLIPSLYGGSMLHVVYAAHTAAGLMRNALNEAVATRQGTARLLAYARTKAQEIRWLTNTAIAIQFANVAKYANETNDTTLSDNG